MNYENNSTKPQGWICPRCEQVNSPDTKQCSCLKTEDTSKDSRKLLLE